MRVLFTMNPAPGHLFSMVPLAWALHLRGDQVLVAVPQPLHQQVRRAGLTAAVVGGDASFFELWPSDRHLGGNEELDLDVFVALAERTRDDIDALVRAWRPDLVVTEPVEYSGPLAATKAGIPWVLQHWGLPVPAETHRKALAGVRNRLEALYAGVTVDPPALTIDTCPLSLGGVPGGTPMRYVPYNAACTIPSWLLRTPERPRVCVSMGTVPIPEGVDGLTAAVHGLAGLDVEIVVSGAGVHNVTDLPEGVKRIGWIPHNQLLPGCALFVHHGGSGSSMAALTAGRPQLLMPQMCDQFAIAERLTAAGAARSIPFPERCAAAVRIEAGKLLADDGYHIRAAELAAEIAAMPSPAAVADALVLLR
ncbi:nucleotide disphospho-sugar-binding domain-containing protein [Dactylosporangium sp. NPDC051541]|uniref:nucleotide disphospho-sugar-binding domain-containing protein n=1 Tax=Dactylosporangium sp. NPDC051541 TaxID=3363977 RepID=UPI0037932C3B